MYRLLLFDFDGTIADSLRQGLEHYNALAEQYGFLPVRNVEAARQMSTRSFFKAHRIPLRRLPKLYREFMSLQRAEMHRVQLCEGVCEVLSVLSRRFRLGILSSNSEENIRTCLRANQAEEHFDFVRSHPRIFGKHTSLRKILKQEGLRREEVVYVGDEVRDAEASSRVGVAFCGVTWGIHSGRQLEAHGARYLANRPSDLLKVLAKEGVADEPQPEPVLGAH
jgi:phosphoglycolate phosphatase